VSSAPLTHTSFVVLALLEMGEPATPYDLKLRLASSVEPFWSIPHTQVYTEAARLAAAGLLKEEREAHGRRRKLYTLTKAGHDALAGWRAEPTAELGQLREPALLKLFFGSDPIKLAETQLPAHRATLASYEAMHAAMDEAVPPGVRMSLEAGIGHAREWIRFWEGVAKSASAGTDSRAA
jgi:DNA-binding PadR family transcriptional regulator